MPVWHVTRTRVDSEWAEVEAEDRDAAIAAFERGEWLGDIGEELDTEWIVDLSDEP